MPAIKINSEKGEILVVPKALVVRQSPDTLFGNIIESEIQFLRKNVPNKVWERWKKKLIEKRVKKK